MADEPNFLDLVALSKITPDLVVEKFGGRINSSFFDGSNILGTLRLKGLIDFTANFPGQSTITVTDQGKQLLKEATDKGSQEFDPIDHSILIQMQQGKRIFQDIGTAVNLRPRDMAIHLYKLAQQQYSVYEIKNGAIEVMLTEKGLMQAKNIMPQAQMPPGMKPQPMPQMATTMPQMQQAKVPEMEMTPGNEAEELKRMSAGDKGVYKDHSLMYKYISVMIVFVIALVVVLVHKGVITL